MLKRLQDTLNGTIIALARMSEKRDPHTAGHQRRTAQLACAIAEKMGFSQDRVEGVAIAAAVHDIGKISIPAEMLSKPGKLSQHEYNIIKCHPEIGYDILKEIASPWPLATIVLQHHERMNGEGYPGGLRGDQIRLESRIVAVSDVVEAMSSHRPYRPPLGRDSAINEIVKNKGVLYDPDVVDVCLEIMKDGFTFD
jgi:HD-GYP domain-containing protein (c-di-GMP phosphodiesterase class II)